MVRATWVAMSALCARLALVLPAIRRPLPCISRATFGPGELESGDKQK